MNTSEPPIELAALKRVLEAEVWDAADRIGRPDCWHRIQDYNDDEMEGYANGVKTGLVCVAESTALGSLDTKQIDAALGERLHRRGSKNAKLQTRRFNNLAVQIRSARVALIDRYEPVDYAGFQEPLQKKLWRMEREGCQNDAEAADLQLVQREFKALCDLHYHLTTDSQWFLRKQAWVERAQVAA